jgi:hypothetical protein
MTQRRPPHTLRANLSWFALTYLLSILAMSFLQTFLTFRLGLGGFALLLPAIAAAAIASFVAGQRYAEFRDDIRRRRLFLALSYTGIAALITVAFPAILIGLQIASSDMSEPNFGHAVWGQVLIVATALALSTPLNFFVSWLVLGRVAQPRVN